MNGARSFLDKGAAKTRIENVIFLLPNDFDTDGYDSCGRKKQAAAVFVLGDDVGTRYVRRHQVRGEKP